MIDKEKMNSASDSQIEAQIIILNEKIENSHNEKERQEFVENVRLLKEILKQRRIKKKKVIHPIKDATTVGESRKGKGNREPITFGENSVRM